MAAVLRSLHANSVRATTQDVVVSEESVSNLLFHVVLVSGRFSNHSPLKNVFLIDKIASSFSFFNMLHFLFYCFSLRHIVNEGREE